LRTKLITNKNIKETIGKLIESPTDYSLVSEIARQYNFRSGINYELKQKLGNNQLLPVSKTIGDITKIIFYITKIMTVL